MHKFEIDTYYKFTSHLNNNKDIIDRIGIKSIKFLENYMDIEYSQNNHNIELTDDEKLLFKFAYYNHDIDYIVNEFEKIQLGNNRVINVDNKSDVNIAIKELTDRLY